MEEAPTDAELARRVRAAGEAGRVAEAELFRRLAPRVRLYGLRHLRDAAAADDLVQEVLLLILERLRAGRVRQPERLASFALGACRLVVRNQRRGQRRRAGLLDRFGAELPRRDEPDPLRREGRRVREYRVAPGGSVQCTVGPDDDVVVARLDAELRGVTRLDLVARVDDGPERRLADVPFDPAGVELAFAPSADELRARPAHVERLRLVAVGSAGERLLGEYTFDHTPWPGRGATA